MKMNDKVLVAFLVSMGLFSVAQAKQYVGGLSAGDKAVLMEARASTPGTETIPVDNQAISSGSAGNDNR